MSAHARYSPSKSAIWATCHGAIAYCERLGMAHGGANEHSASGTLTHAIAQAYLDADEEGGDLDIAAFALGTTHVVDGFKFTIDEERMERVNHYVAAIRARKGLKFIEVTLPLSDAFGAPDQSGTGDAVVADLENHVLEVHDLKDGNGKVSAQENDQGVCYGLGGLQEFSYLDDFKEVHFYIHQPKISWQDRAVYTIDEMNAHRERLREAVRKNERLRDPSMSINKIISAMNPSDKACRWCDAAGVCPARAKSVVDQFPDLTEQPAQMDAVRIGELLKRRPTIEAWFAQLAGTALALARQGTTIPGFKLSKGREGPRKWIDETAAEEVLYEAVQHEAYKRTVLSPTDAQKKLKKFPEVWEALQGNISRSEGQPSLVPEADGRPALVASMEEFGVVDNGDDLL